MTDDDHRATRLEVGLLLVGHGSSDPRGVDEFLATARQVAAGAGPWAVEPCFLEFSAPSIAEGVERLAVAGARRIVVAPVMLFAARHIRHDIPRQLALAVAGFPGVTVTQAEHLGCHPSMVELSRRRYDEALAGTLPVPPEETVLVIVGRGSHDQEATGEMLHFAQLRHQTTPVADARTAFLTMASPRLEQVLDEVAHAVVKRVVVQPHLLFAGELLGRIRSLVDRYACEFTHAEWRLAAHLGPAEPLATAILQRASAAQATQAGPR